MSLARKGTVQAHTTGQLALTYTESGVGGPPVPRVFLGGVSSGFHSVPQIGDQVLTLYESAMNPFPQQTISTTDTPNLLPTLNTGESGIYHHDGRIAAQLLNTGVSVLLQDFSHVGLPQLYYDPAVPGWTLSSNGSGLGAPNASMTLAGTSGSTGIVLTAHKLPILLTCTGLGAGPITLSSSTIAFNGNTTNTGTLTVTGLSTLTGGATLGADLDAQTHNLKNVGFISDGATAGSGNWSIDSSGNALLAGTIGVTGLATLTAGASLGANLQMNSHTMLSVASISHSNSTPDTVWSIDTNGAGVLAGGLTVQTKIIASTQASLPTLTRGAALGSGGAIASSVTGSDIAGTISLTYGTAPSGTGTLVTLNFNTSQGNTTYRVFLQPNSNASSTVGGLFVTTKNTGSFIVSSANMNPVNGTVLVFDYWVVN